MKKILFVLCLSNLQTYAQDTAENQLEVYDTLRPVVTYIQFQYQRTYHAPGFKPDSSTLLGTYPWLWLSTGRKWGIFLFLSREAGSSTGVSMGPYVSFERPKAYHEIGVGPGMEIPDSFKDPESKIVPYGWGYYYFENHTDRRLAKGKIIFQIQYANAPKDWGSWVMVSGTWSPFQKFVSIGFWGQTETSWGGKLQLNVPLGKVGVFDIWAGGGKDENITFGTDLIFQFTGKTKLKKRIN